MDTTRPVLGTDTTRRRAFNVLLGLALVAGLGLTAFLIADSWGGLYWLFDGAAGALAGMLALIRRRQPVWTAAAGLGIGGLAVAAARMWHLPAEPGPVLALALAVLVGSAVRRLPPVPAGALGAGGLAVVAAAYLTVRPPASGGSAVVAMNALAWLCAVAAGLALRLQDHRATTTAEEVRRDERLELARELHDVVAHHITGMLIQAQAARLVAAENPDQVAASLAGIEAAGAEGLRAMRRVVGLLRDNEDAPPASAGPEQLGDLVERFNRQGPPVRLRAAGESAGWPPEVTSTVYRIVREALTNVTRHAPHARGVTVTVSQDPSAVTVEVTDDAPPGPARAPLRGGYGLVGMRERVETLGGTMRAGPAPDAGWAVLATLPLESAPRRRIGATTPPDNGSPR